MVQATGPALYVYDRTAGSYQWVADAIRFGQSVRISGDGRILAFPTGSGALLLYDRVTKTSSKVLGAGVNVGSGPEAFP